MCAFRDLALQTVDYQGHYHYVSMFEGVISYTSAFLNIIAQLDYQQQNSNTCTLASKLIHQSIYVNIDSYYLGRDWRV